MKTSKDMPPAAVRKGIETGKQRAWYPLALIFAIVALGIFVGGLLSYSNYERRYRTGIEQQLSAITELKVAQIVRWRHERLLDARYLRSTPYVARRALDVLSQSATQPGARSTRQMFASWLNSMFASGSYEQVLLLDEHLNVGLVYPEGTSGVLSEVALRAAQQALRSQEVVLTDLHRETADGPVYLSMMVPLVVRREGARESVPAAGKGSSPADRSAGLLVLQINVRKDLYPLIRLWPTLSQTAESLLVRRDGNDALFLNELKFRTNAALRLRIPLARTDVPAVKAVLGQEGIVEGTDYRGEQVLAALRAVPDTPWLMVARMDLAEVYAPLHARLWMTVLIMVALLLGTGASVGMVWRQQRVQYYRERLEAAAALQLSQQKLSLHFDQTPLAVVEFDLEGRVREWNPAAVTVFGYSREEAIGQHWSFIVPAAIHGPSGRGLGGNRGPARRPAVHQRKHHQGRPDDQLRVVQHAAHRAGRPDRRRGVVDSGHHRAQAGGESTARERGTVSHDHGLRLPTRSSCATRRAGYWRPTGRPVKASGIPGRNCWPSPFGTLIPRRARPESTRLWGKILAGEQFTFESRQRRKDGSVFPVEVTLGLVRLPAGPAVLGLRQGHHRAQAGGGRDSPTEPDLGAARRGAHEPTRSGEQGTRVVLLLRLARSAGTVAGD